MKATRNSTRSARWAVAGLMLAAIVPLAGCDLAGSMFALAKTTAQDAVLDSATALIEGTIDGVIGGIVPGQSD